MSSTEARQHFAELLELGSRQPVMIKRQNREVGVFIPMEDFQKLRQLQMKELNESVASLSEEAKANGLTEVLLNEILEEVNPS